MFVAAVPTNRQSFFSWFDHIIVLQVDATTLEHRLLHRAHTTSSYGRDAAERAGALAFNKIFPQEFASVKNVTFIDATMPISKVVDAIVTTIALLDNSPLSQH